MSNVRRIIPVAQARLGLAGPEGHVERITPEIARHLLGGMMRNRLVKDARVNVYAEAMRSGDFKSLNGECLVINRDGALEDGQHRLHALLKSGLPYMDFLVVRGVEPGSGQTNGQGAPRQPSDIATMRGYENSRVLMAAVRWLWTYENDWPGGLSHVRTLSVATLLKYLEANAHLVVANEEIRKNYGQAGRLMMASIATFVRVVTDRLSPKQSNDFFEALNTGEAQPQSRQVIKLRDRLMSRESARNRLRPAEIIVITARTWNAMRAGREVSKLYIGRETAEHGGEPYRTAPRFE